MNILRPNVLFDIQPYKNTITVTRGGYFRI